MRALEFRTDRPLILTPYANGGWTITQVSNIPGERNNDLGAYSSLADVLKDLASAIGATVQLEVHTTTHEPQRLVPRQLGPFNPDGTTWAGEATPIETSIERPRQPIDPEPIVTKAPDARTATMTFDEAKKRYIRWCDRLALTAPRAWDDLPPAERAAWMEGRRP